MTIGIATSCIRFSPKSKIKHTLPAMTKPFYFKLPTSYLTSLLHPRQQIQHRHPDRDAVFYLMENDGMFAVCDI